MHVVWFVKIATGLPYPVYTWELSCVLLSSINQWIDTTSLLTDKAILDANTCFGNWSKNSKQFQESEFLALAIKEQDQTLYQWKRRFE